MNRFILFLFILICSSFTENISSQISSTASKYTSHTAYSSGQQDSVYFYSSEAEIELKCDNSDIEISYAWFKYDFNSQNWEISPFAITKSISNITEGGYKVEVKNGTNTTSYVCWTFVPEVTGTPLINTETPSCEPLASSVINATLKPLSYIDLNSTNKSVKTFSYLYHWVSELNEVNAFFDQSSCKLEIYYSDELFASIGIGKAGNELGMELMDAGSKYIDDVRAVKAFFTQTMEEAPDESLEIDPDKSAPLTYTFNAFPETGEKTMGNYSSIDWDIYKKIDANTEEIDYSKSGVGILPPYDFEEIGTYYMKLTVKNDYCESSYDQAGEIVVTDSKVEIPNVFTPNGDGYNDVFKVKYKSIKSFSMVIVNRWGRTLFQTNNIEEGWSGKYGGKIAPPDVYYYDIVWEGYDGVKGKQKGFLHLLTDRR